jgi:hypothetical protein
MLRRPLPCYSRCDVFVQRERKSRFLDSAESSAFVDDSATLEMTIGN